MTQKSQFESRIFAGRQTQVDMVAGNINSSYPIINSIFLLTKYKLEPCTNSKRFRQLRIKNTRSI
jgi:hypothetical protein